MMFIPTKPGCGFGILTNIGPGSLSFGDYNLFAFLPILMFSLELDNEVNAFFLDIPYFGQKNRTICLWNHYLSHISLISFIAPYIHFSEDLLTAYQTVNKSCARSKDAEMSVTFFLPLKCVS